MAKMGLMDKFPGGQYEGLTLSEVLDKDVAFVQLQIRMGIIELDDRTTRVFGVFVEKAAKDKAGKVGVAAEVAVEEPVVPEVPETPVVPEVPEVTKPLFDKNATPPAGEPAVEETKPEEVISTEPVVEEIAVTEQEVIADAQPPVVEETKSEEAQQEEIKPVVEEAPVTKGKGLFGKGK